MQKGKQKQNKDPSSKELQPPLIQSYLILNFLLLILLQKLFKILSYTIRLSFINYLLLNICLIVLPSNKSCGWYYLSYLVVTFYVAASGLSFVLNYTVSDGHKIARQDTQVSTSVICRRVFAVFKYVAWSFLIIVSRCISVSHMSDLELVMNGLRRFKHSADFLANSSQIIESAAISASQVSTPLTHLH